MTVAEDPPRGTKLTIDLATGALVTTPPEQPQPPALTQNDLLLPRTVDETDRRLRYIQETLSRAARLGSSARKTWQFAAARFRDLELDDQPGIVNIEDEFWVGWCNWESPHHGISRMSGPLGYLFIIRLSEQQALHLNGTLKHHPLTPTEVRVLRGKPDETSSDLYMECERKGSEFFLAAARGHLDDFWATAAKYQDGKDTVGLSEHLKVNLLTIAVWNSWGKKNYEKRIAALQNEMERIGVSVIPTSLSGCLVATRHSVLTTNYKYRSLPLPHKLIPFFQRYRVLGQEPMLESEFIRLYKQLVDPDTKLFDQSPARQR